MSEKKLASGTWTGNADLHFEGGQLMHFKVKNINVLGTTLTIDASNGESQGSLILPRATEDYSFSRFGNEPQGWRFHISSDSDVVIVSWDLFSTWIPGDPPNP
jgi:hypothetical protein